MKKFAIFLIVIVLVISAIVVAKNIIVKSAVISGVKAITGLTVNMENIDVGVLNTFIGIKQLTLLNPPEFPDPVMLDMPEIYLDYNLSSLIDKKLHIEELRVNLKKFVVVRNREGKLNLDLFRMDQSGKEHKVSPEEKKAVEKDKKSKMPELKIDVLELKIDRVVFKDYSRSTPPKINEFKVNIDERYENITDTQSLVGLIVAKSLMNTEISRHFKSGLNQLKNELKTSIDGSTKSTKKEQARKKEELKKKLEETVDKLKEQFSSER